MVIFRQIKGLGFCLMPWIQMGFSLGVQETISMFLFQIIFSTASQTLKSKVLSKTGADPCHVQPFLNAAVASNISGGLKSKNHFHLSKITHEICKCPKLNTIIDDFFSWNLWIIDPCLPAHPYFFFAVLPLDYSNTAAKTSVKKSFSCT